MENNQTIKTNTKESTIKSGFTTKKLTLVAMLGAISTILMYLEFPVPLVPSFVKMDFSDLPIVFGGFLMGPLAGFFIIVIKIALNFLLKGTQSMGVGELANMIYSASYMIPAVLIYRSMKKKKRLWFALLVAMLVASATAIFVNIIFIFPAYAKLFGMSMEAIVGMATAVNPYVKDMITFMIFAMLPFNLVKFGLVSLIAGPLYKRIRKY